MRLSGGTYQLRIILHIVPAVISWCPKRTNYGEKNQTGLVTLGNGQKALSPHPGIQPRSKNHTGAVRFGRDFGSEVLFGDLETLANLENSTFMASLKRFITRRERPSKIFSDNGRAFMGAAKPIKGIEKDKEQMKDCLTS